MKKLEPEPIHNENELEFAIFCIENVAIQLGIDTVRVYHALAEKSDILNGYIIPCYDVLHTQSKEYIVNDIISYMEEKGVQV
ncbi:MAG: DUF3791 domain-containing protein [Bacteroides sp.]|nr:DUF3791 domain-containing protein [Bacteroides sp.]MCM1550421.1 DUF3791 domain-containing protein [Clostridium sp.]